ncbi:MAG TPA: hypothetical protein PLV45_12825, partial [bacterium]|nr:hypothetical protein [bacterium]
MQECSQNQIVRLWIVVVGAGIVMGMLPGCPGAPLVHGMDWRQGAYDAADWPAGYAPLGFDDPSLQTVIDPGRPAYYFRKLFFLPSTYDPSISRLRMTVHTGDGVIMSFHGREAGRSSWLPPGDLPYEYTGTFTDPAGQQTVELTDILFQCENSIGSNWRTVTVEVHRSVPGDAFRFDAVMEAYIEGSWQSIIPEGSQWTYCPDSAVPAATAEPVIHCLRYPLAGMPAVTEPG